MQSFCIPRSSEVDNHSCSTRVHRVSHPATEDTDRATAPADTDGAAAPAKEDPLSVALRGGLLDDMLLEAACVLQRGGSNAVVMGRAIPAIQKEVNGVNVVRTLIASFFDVV